MTYPYNARLNYYSFLSGMPKGWQLIYSITAGVVKGDTIEVIEIDNGGIPTGNTMTGTVNQVYTNIDFTYKEDNVLLYVIPD